MLSRNLYKVKKKRGGDKKKKSLIYFALTLSFLVIAFGIYNFSNMTKTDGVKEEVKVETGDRPLAKEIMVYINADKGLSLRKDRDANAERLVVIPDKTKLTATEELDGWYKVSYDGKDGWISKQYTTIEVPVVDQTKSWSVYNGVGFKVRYPLGWKVQDYGANAATKTTSLVAFSNQDLPATLPQGSEFVAPIIAKVTTQTIDEAKKTYASISGVTTAAVSVGSLSGTKYTYVAASTNTQVNSILVSAGTKVIVFSESGGYLDDLNNILKTFSL